jgi:hypothetical protein
LPQIQASSPKRRVAVHQVRAGGGDALRQSLHELHVRGGHELEVRHGDPLCQESPTNFIDWDRPGVRPTIGRMPSYEPVDLSAACNAGVEVLGDEPGDVAIGKADLRGLPFLIGSEPPSGERCFLLPTVPVSVGIGTLARRVIIAHRLLEPGAPAGHAVGHTVAEYAFHLAGGEVVIAAIRERFEIQVVPPDWGQGPFLAVTDTSNSVLHR